MREQALAQILRASGVVSCNNGRIGAATLIDAGTVLSVAHVFIYPQGKRPSGLECRFYPQNETGKTEYVRLDLARIHMGAKQITGVNICSNSRDWAIAALETPLTDRPVAPLARLPAKNAPLKLVSFLQGLHGQVASCTVRDLIGPCAQNGVPLVFTDCPAQAGDSGGAVFVWEDGQWKLAAITRGASHESGKVYDRARIYHMAVPVMSVTAPTSAKSPKSSSFELQ